MKTVIHLFCGIATHLIQVLFVSVRLCALLDYVCVLQRGLWEGSAGKGWPEI